MKIAIITDQHFGARNDSLHFLDFYEKFYSETFFPKLDESGVKTLLILGDTFDRRKYVNFYSLQRAKKMFFDGLAKREILVYMLVGNHDTYYKNTNEVNSPELLLEDYPNILVIESPQTLHLDYGNVKADVCMMPWICADNYDASMEEIKTTTATVCMGHFEIEGFQMYRGAPSQEGLEPKMFNKFDQVFSGHYHHKSSRGNIHYLGNPYELTWQDHNDPRGFHFFDLETHELEFVENPNRMFMKLVYDDKADDIKTITNMNLSHLKSTYVKVVVINKTNPYLFDLLINNLYKVNPIDITIAEDFTELEEIEENDVDQAEDTTTILNKYVDNLSTDLDKDKLKTILRHLYVEAMNEEI
jgi:DNA repair exonuclease SbcCD nuclease subunit